MRQRTVLNIFVGSPGDLQEERKAAKDVIDRLNRYLARNLDLYIELRGWEDTPPGFSRPQEKINDDVRSCNLFVGLLWKKWGTPTEQYSSGFEEEFEIALKRKQNGELKDIWLFFKQVSQDLLQNPGEQLKKVLDFKLKIETERKIFFKPFESKEEWTLMFYDYLSDYFSKGLVVPIGIPTASSVVSIVSDFNKKSIPIGVLADRKEIVSTVNNVLSSISDDEKLRTLDSYTKSRIYLLSSALLYDSVLPSELLDTHEIQFLYKNREKVELLPIEKKLIVRTLLADEYEIKAGWFWFQDATVQFEQVLEILAYSDRSEDVRKNALTYLSLITQSPDLEMVRLRFDDSSEEVRMESIRFFEQHGQVSDIPPLKSIFAVGSSKVAEAAWTAIFAILSRDNPDEAIEWLRNTANQREGNTKIILNLSYYRPKRKI